MPSTLMCRVRALWEMMDSLSVNHRQFFLFCLSFSVLLLVSLALWYLQEVGNIAFHCSNPGLISLSVCSLLSMQHVLEGVFSVY